MLKEYRCDNCKKLFFKGDIRHAVIEIKCKKCKNIITIKEANSGLEDVIACPVQENVA